jgi:uncharacterized protein (DUF983 family)
VMEINWWFRYEDGDANWCPDCGEMRGVCTCGPMCQTCGGTMELESSYENEARVVVHQYWCKTCRVMRDVVEAGS